MVSGLTIKKFSEGLRAKEFSARETVESYLARIEKRDPEIGAYLYVLKNAALKTADEVDTSLAKGDRLPPLAGVPLAIKDVILIEDEFATAGSRILEHYSASYDSGVIKKLKEAHAVFLGKTNLDEFAMGSSTENSGFQLTRNPHDLERVPGGSSGGSAAAVAADLAVASLGSDTGGSIRQPAAFTGIVGLKPTYGAVSRSGLIALASSLDQIGPFAKTVEDAALLFDAIRGSDPLDATSQPDTSLDPAPQKITDLKIGIPQEYFAGGLDSEVEHAIREAIRDLEQSGFVTKHISLPHTKYALSCYYIILPAEASANLARFDGIRYSRIDADAESALTEIYFNQRGRGFGPEPKRRIILGTFVLSSGYYDAYYRKAQEVRALIRQDFADAFREVDVILAPVTPTPAFKIGEKVDDPLAMYLSDIFTLPVNLAGLPALALPAKSKTKNNLPIGFQLIGKHFREADLFGVGRHYEEL